jgi:hypothetical protein
VFEPSGVDETLAAYAWDLRFHAFDPAGREIVETRSFNTNLPAYLEVEFKAIPPAIAPRLRTLNAQPENWDPDSDFFQRNIQPHTEQFRTRIRLASAPPKS